MVIEREAPLPIEAFEACLARAEDARLRGFDPETRDGYQTAVEAALRRCQIEICTRVAAENRISCQSAIARTN